MERLRIKRKWFQRELWQKQFNFSTMKYQRINFNNFINHQRFLPFLFSFHCKDISCIAALFLFSSALWKFMCNFIAFGKYENEKKFPNVRDYVLLKWRREEFCWVEACWKPWILRLNSSRSFQLPGKCSVESSRIKVPNNVLSEMWKRFKFKNISLAKLLNKRCLAVARHIIAIWADFSFSFLGTFSDSRPTRTVVFINKFSGRE